MVSNDADHHTKLLGYQMPKKEFVSYEEARKHAQSIGIKSKSKWCEYYRSGNKPDNIPTDPSKTYKNKGWISWGEFFGTGVVAYSLREVVSYEEASRYVQSLGIRTGEEWQEYCSNGNKPDNIPTCPSKTYKNKGWISWGEFLGTSTVATFLIEFISYEEASKHAQSLGIKSQGEWFKYCRSGNKPDNIPYSPHGTYKNKGWISWGEFLGTGSIAPSLKKFVSYEEACKYVQSLGIKSQGEWFNYCRNVNKPDNIPSKPYRTYKNKGWISWGEFFGTGAIAPQFREFISYEEACKYVQSLGKKSQSEWLKYCRSGNKPDNIPTDPYSVYKNKGWISWGEFLGTGVIATQSIEFISYEEASRYAQSLGIKSQSEWQEHWSNGGKSDNIPYSPHCTYKNKGWISWGEFLGTGVIAPQFREFISYEEARKYVQSLGIKNQREWFNYYRSGNKPDNIPTDPYSVYKNKGWVSWIDFLNTNVRELVSYEEACRYAQSLGIRTGEEWQEHCRSGNKPDNIPAIPYAAYKNKGWISWGEFLGTGSIAPSLKEFVSYEEACKYVQSLGISGSTEWYQYCDSGNKPDNIPTHPQKIYKNEGWENFEKFTGNCSKSGFNIFKPSTIYLLDCGHWYKFGISNHVNKRIKQLETGNEMKVKVVGLWNFENGVSTLKIETKIKQHIRSKKIKQATKIEMPSGHTETFHSEHYTKIVKLIETEYYRVSKKQKGAVTLLPKSNTAALFKQHSK